MEKLIVFTIILILLAGGSQAIAMKHCPPDIKRRDNNVLFDEAFQVVSSYGHIIETASRLFQVPQKIIISVILTESGGNPVARAKTSSAKGLMQTIDSTFNMAYKSLEARGIRIVRDPLNPRASIMAGTWYLDRMYDRAVMDLKADPDKRQTINAWKTALDYYHTGPESRTMDQSKEFYQTPDEEKYANSVLYVAANIFYPDQTLQQEYQQAEPDKIIYPKHSYFIDHESMVDKGFD